MYQDRPARPRRFLPQPAGEQRREARFPVADGLVGDFIAALQQPFGDLTKAELVAQPPEHGYENDVGGVLEIVEAEPVRSLKILRQERQAKVRSPSEVRRARLLVWLDSQRGHVTSLSSPGRWTPRR